MFTVQLGGPAPPRNCGLYSGTEAAPWQSLIPDANTSYRIVTEAWVVDPKAPGLKDGAGEGLM